jgi:hypothetical protein
VDRRAHQGCLHDAPALQRPRQRVALQALDARPQPDVHRRRVLRLQATHSFQRARQRGPRPLEEKLAREQGAVQISCAQGSHGYSCSIHPGMRGTLVVN